MVFTIKRSKWARAGINGLSTLLNSLGNQCCIGQVCSQIGIDNKYIYLCPMVRAVMIRYPYAFKDQNLDLSPIIDKRGEYIDQCSWLNQCYILNDREDLSEVERENALSNWAKKNGHEFIFVD